MKILVLGSDGQLGKCLNDQLKNIDHESIFFSRSDLDISNLNLLRKKILLTKPNIIINAAAFTGVDKAETEKKLAYLINHRAVEVIANTCKELNSWLIHVSTDYVFDGFHDHPYNETYQTNPQSVYGASKLAGESAIQSSGCKHLIIRTSWVFSEYGNNFLKTMISLGIKNNELNVVDDQIGCPTYAQDIAKTIVYIAPKLTQEKLDSNIFHYCGDNPCSWYEFSVFIFNEAKKYGYKSPNCINKIKTKDYKTEAKRPQNSSLDCFKIEKHFGIKPSNWSLGVKQVLKKQEF